jgi:uncharacterized protein
MRAVKFVAYLLVAPIAALALFMLLEARSDPLVRRADLTLPGMAPDATLRVVLLSDIHIGTLAMDADRLGRIVAQVNALQPDLVLIAGDFIYGADPHGAAKLGEPMVAPLSRLRARYGVAAVLGNHDVATGPATVRRQLYRAGVILLENRARIFGPIALGGVSDASTVHDDVGAALASARALHRPIVMLTHSPDIAPKLPDDAPLLFAGHTHCGQGVLLGHGLAPEVSRFGKRFQCGLIREGARTVLVTGGLGTSGVPLRIGAPPDLWLVTLHGTKKGPDARPAPSIR